MFQFRSIAVALAFSFVLFGTLAKADEALEKRMSDLEKRITELETRPVRGCANFKPDCSITAGTKYWRAQGNSYFETDTYQRQNCEGQTIQVILGTRFNWRLVRVSCPGLLPDCSSIVVDNRQVIEY